MTFFKKPQPLVTNRPLKMKPDYSLFLLRLIILIAAAAALLAVFPGLKILEPSAERTLVSEGSPPVHTTETGIGVAIFCVVLILTFCIRKANEWERAIILRFGKFKKVKGPGLFFLMPVADRITQIVDMRIRVSDFSAQKTLTGDSVTVDVDAICFWLVWDPQKAVLEVENYPDAVVYSSKTALRNSISSHDLSTFLERSDIIQKQIQEEVDKKTTEWGITVLHIELTDIQIPEALQDSLSRVAQAEREKKGRILLAEAEIEIANRLQEAAKIYSTDDLAMKLKILSILNEGLEAGNSMMLVPNSIAEELKTKDIFGLKALNEIRRKEKESENDSSKS